MASWSGRWSEPRFALIYDELYPAEGRFDFFVDLAGGNPLNILDIGCGTGRLACELARRGHRVIAADPAPVMLDVARHRSGAENVSWIDATARTLCLDMQVDLVVMTGHVFQVFLDDEEVSAALRNIRRHLSSGGRLSFETRNPAARIWDTWSPEEPRRCEIADLGVVESYRLVQSVDGEFVTYEHHLRFGEEAQINTSTMRFISQRDLARLLEETGFDDVVWYGDWDRPPVSPDGPELIVVAR